jgi:hypothetical protein
MFGIRKALKRAFSIETIATAVERKIASDMAADPTHPRNAAGFEMIGAIQAVRSQAIARRELEALLPEYNRRAMDLLAAVDRFNSQTPEWRGANPEIRAELDSEDRALNEMAEQIKTLDAMAGGNNLTSVAISNG